MTPLAQASHLGVALALVNVTLEYRGVVQRLSDRQPANPAECMAVAPVQVAAVLDQHKEHSSLQSDTFEEIFDAALNSMQFSPCLLTFEVSLCVQFNSTHGAPIFLL